MAVSLPDGVLRFLINLGRIDSPDIVRAEYIIIHSHGTFYLLISCLLLRLTGIDEVNTHHILLSPGDNYYPGRTD